MEGSIDHFKPRCKWQNQLIKRHFKNRHRRSRNDKLKRISSNSVKQLPRNGKTNSHLINRLQRKQVNASYSLNKYLKKARIYDDFDENYNLMSECFESVNTVIPIWQCSKCTFINEDRSLHCSICNISYNNESHDDSSQSNDSQSYLSLSSIKLKISKKKNKNKFKRKKKKSKKTKAVSIELDEGYLEYKKFMKKQKTSIMAFKKVEFTDRSRNNYKISEIEKQEKEANVLMDLYKIVYLNSQQNDNNQIKIEKVIESMIAFIPKEHLKLCRKQINENVMIKKQCQVCFIKDSECEMVSMKKYCNDCMICSDCLSQNMKINVREKQVLPWICCAAPDCKAPIDCSLLFEYLDISDLYAFAKIFIYKHLQRNSNFIECSDSNNEKCKFGWLRFIGSQSYYLKCDACHCVNDTRNNNNKNGNNNEFESLLQSGLLRECPKCLYPTMKDYGMCNVMHCAKCGVYWNWSTKDMGSTSDQVKTKARNNGSLWEAGELSYQLNLQNHDLPAFIELLKKNGIKYDPNYRRGT